MSLILSGSDGLSDIDGSAATPAIRGTDANTGIFFPAADTIAFSEGGVEAARFDSAGNLGIGTTSPATRLDVSQANAKSATGVWQTQIFDSTSQTTGVGGGISFSGYKTAQSSAEVFAAIDAYKENSTAGNAAGALRFHTQVSGGSGLVERARIDSSGNLLVGTTNSSQVAGVGLKLKYSATEPAYSVVGSLSTSANSGFVMYSTGAGAYRFYVDYAGTIFATSTSISAISDQTLKTNVRDLETGLTEVLALQPRRFDWINGDATNVAGFVAQEVEEVLPELVTNYKYNTDAQGNDIFKKSLKMGDILPTLVKAIQEQQALITQLQADVAALKAAA